MAFCYGVAAVWPLPLDAERILNVAPLFHIWGFCYTLIFPVYLRAFMDLLPAYKPAAVLEEFQKRRITTFAGGPAALYMGLRANENFSKTDFSSLRVCLSGGAACPVELIRFWESATGSVLLEGWGMSEGAPIHQNPLMACARSDLSVSRRPATRPRSSIWKAARGSCRPANAARSACADRNSH